MSLRFARRSSVGVAAFLTAVSSAAVAAPTASAAPYGGTEAVFFGDSFFANPSYFQVGDWRGDLARQGMSSEHYIESEPGAPSPQGCPQGKKTVANQYGAITGRSVANYACSSAKAIGDSNRKNFRQQIDGAVANHDLTGDTKHVFVQFGANNLQEVLLAEFNGDTYKQSLVNNARRIRQVAPNATITFVGYPAISASNGAVCPVRTRQSSQVGLNVDVLGAVRAGEDRINSSMWDAANAAGARYVDLRSASIDHNMCAPDDIRWVAGVSEYAVPHNLYNHLTHAGVDGVANILKSRS